MDICAKAQRTSYLNVDVYYWIQRPRSISHEAGKKKNTEKFLNDMLWYIEEKKQMIDIPQNFQQKSNNTRYATNVKHGNKFRC